MYQMSRSNCTADQRLCFRYTDSTIPRLLLACFCDCPGRFMSDLVGNPEDRFSCVAAQMSTPNMSFILAIYIVMGPIVLSKGSGKKNEIV